MVVLALIWFVNRWDKISASIWLVNRWDKISIVGYPEVTLLLYAQSQGN
jgi:hypothetical protein